MPKQTTTIKIDSNLWKDFRKYCIDINKYPSHIIEELIGDLLNAEKKKE